MNEPSKETVKEILRMAHQELCDLDEESNRSTKPFMATLKESNDKYDCPEHNNELLCSKCGLPAPVVESDSLKWADAMGYKKHRMRIIVKCNQCDERTVYRLGGYVVKNGEHVKECE